ncbi:putative oxidoreductase-like protein [Hapsidospora chrysogenum ATCC 11550]|uniref:Putative oxidoreductase-like protein n=1 Tax=Hapsidospora chrysogenum (strain ATCC 11550 / CBS 779.69 / DSM 880 / IAM 14645 / JCM 23072 / IMI 49137) TaxID=857340 RepID=A0A086SZJ5_HAPC1|nr:putative oxidoreductase-like protein [Hapsidospora chrysogenum ATCC 11550]
MLCQTTSVRFDAATDMPSFEGKVILVTGGNAGLGKQSVLDYARHNPRQIWLAARSLNKAQTAIDKITTAIPQHNNTSTIIKPLELDLASFVSIRKAAETFLAESDRLDILMLNAGIMGTEPGLTEDGYEIQFGTNHMGHALLTKLLLPALTRTAAAPDSDVRVVCMSSYGHTQVPDGGFRFDTPRTLAEDLGPYGRYYQSKLANVLFARHLAKVYPQLTVASVHPGLVQTQLMDRASGTPTYVKVLTKIGYRLLKTPEDGAKNQLWASVSRDVKSGEYYEPVGVGGKASANGTNDELARQLWEWTEMELEGVKAW